MCKRLTMTQHITTCTWLTQHIATSKWLTQHNHNVHMTDTAHCTVYIGCLYPKVILDLSSIKSMQQVAPTSAMHNGFSLCFKESSHTLQCTTGCFNTFPLARQCHVHTHGHFTASWPCHLTYQCSKYGNSTGAMSTLRRCDRGMAECETIMVIDWVLDLVTVIRFLI